MQENKKEGSVIQRQEQNQKKDQKRNAGKGSNQKNKNQKPEEYEKRGDIRSQSEEPSASLLPKDEAPQKR
jgi:hypothetical protein